MLAIIKDRMRHAEKSILPTSAQHRTFVKVTIVLWMSETDYTGYTLNQIKYYYKWLNNKYTHKFIT